MDLFSLCRLRRGAFTLPELLVVIAVIALLAAILMPALGRARATARMVRELAAAKQNTATYINYTADFKDAVVPALPHWDTIRRNCPAPPHHQLRAPDPFNSGAFINGGLCKVWFFYLQGWAGTPLHGWQVDKRASDEFLLRSRQTPQLGWTDYTQNSAATAFGFHPSLGLNGVFMGGSFRHGGLGGMWGLTNGSADFYVTRLAQVRDPARLTVFSSARGGDVATSMNLWSWGQGQPNSGRIQPGYFLVLPPLGAPNAPAWTGGDQFNSGATPSSWGNVAFRHLNQACVSAVDGHASTINIKAMRDMRLWSNYAEASNWFFRPTH